MAHWRRTVTFILRQPLSSTRGTTTSLVFFTPPPRCRQDNRPIIHSLQCHPIRHQHTIPSSWPTRGRLRHAVKQSINNPLFTGPSSPLKRGLYPDSQDPISQNHTTPSLTNHGEGLHHNTRHLPCPTIKSNRILFTGPSSPSREGLYPDSTDRGRSDKPYHAIRSIPNIVEKPHHPSWEPQPLPLHQMKQASSSSSTRRTTINKEDFTDVKLPEPSSAYANTILIS